MNTTASSAMPVFLGLGSNEGERAAHLRAAVEHLDGSPTVEVVDTSPVYETEAHTRSPDEVQPAFLNAVVRVRTDLSPERLLRRARRIERLEGRDRDAGTWVPRPLDIDLLAYDQAVRDTDLLTLPHPRLAERRFVLRPWADLAPNFVLPPPFDQSVQTLLDRCSDATAIRQTDLRLRGDEPIR